MPKDISRLPARSSAKGLTSTQGVLDLQVDKETEIQGIGMGVLSDGTPFLTQRGLARLCGVENRHIATIGADWNDEIQKGRITIIKGLLSKRGITLEKPFHEVRRGNAVFHAYPDTACLAILEYFAFEADTQNQAQARDNFRTLAGSALQTFIYTQVGYDPNNSVPAEWKQFHDRVALTYNAVPVGYFGVFKEIADLVVTLGQNGLHIDSTFVPDGSVGIIWGKHWTDRGLDEEYGARRKYDHNYPSYFPQSLSNPQEAWCYPEHSLGEFRRWFRENYIGDGKFAAYLQGKVRRQELPASFAQLAIAAYNPAEE